MKQIKDLILCVKKYKDCIFALADALEDAGFVEASKLCRECEERIKRSEENRCLDCGSTQTEDSNDTHFLECKECNIRLRGRGLMFWDTSWRKGSRRKKYSQRLLKTLFKKLPSELTTDIKTFQWGHRLILSG